MLSRLLREFLFTVIHLVVNILVAVQTVYWRLLNKRKDLPNDQVTQDDILALSESLQKMRKDLKHVVVLANKNHSTSDLARLVIWSLIIGVPYISFYDITGDLKVNDDSLFFEVQKKKKGIPGCIKWSNKPNLNGYTNGNLANTIVINIFSSTDGKQKITRCIKNIAEDSSIQIDATKEYTAEEFNKILSPLYPAIPDPELVLYSGPLCCTYGVLPWQIRLSEFIQLSTSNTIHVENYIDAIYKYNKCDQRFGK